MTSTRAVFLDALGTLVELEPPWVHLGRALGGQVPQEQVIAAMRAEMRYYRAHSHEGRDPASLADLRERCAATLSRELGRRVDADTLIAAIRFRAYPDVSPALEALRTRGLRLVCVSNWDCSLPEVLERCGVRGMVDGVVSSAVAGARKPDPAIFEPALELAGCRPGEALHVGDTPEEDLAGAAAAAIRALLLDRKGRGDSGAVIAPRIASLTEIQHHLEP